MLLAEMDQIQLSNDLYELLAGDFTESLSALETAIRRRAADEWDDDRWQVVAEELAELKNADYEPAEVVAVKTAVEIATYDAYEGDLDGEEEGEKAA